MKAQATHPKFSEWQTREISCDYLPIQHGNSIMVKGEYFGGVKFFPMSCVSVCEFEIIVPIWLLKKKQPSLLTIKNKRS